jgi:hypothetical protein
VKANVTTTTYAPGPTPNTVRADDAVGNRKLVRDYGHWFWNSR